MIPTWVKLAALAAILAGLYGLWNHDREAYAARKVQALADSVRAEAERDAAAKLETWAKRVQASESAASAAQGELNDLKGLLDERQTAIAARDRVIGGLRNSITVTRRSEIRSDPGSPCSTQELRSERLAILLEEGQRRSIEVAESNGELEGLVLACESGARTDAVMFRWAQRAMEAMRLGAEVPPAP
jgi:hypothetical protein